MNIKDIIAESIATKQSILDTPGLLETIREVAEICTSCFSRGGKVLLCGNGGSAADAQHLAAELSGRFKMDRDPLYAEALHVNTSFITAVANDYSFDEVYSRMIKASGRKGDVLIAISTSGNSTNIIRAAEVANNIGMITLGLTGASGGKLAKIAKYTVKVPSTDTARIQESHIMIGHIICGLVESDLFAK